MLKDQIYIKSIHLFERLAFTYHPWKLDTQEIFITVAQNPP